MSIFSLGTIHLDGYFRADRSALGAGDAAFFAFLWILFEPGWEVPLLVECGVYLDGCIGAGIDTKLTPFASFSVNLDFSFGRLFRHNLTESPSVIAPRPVCGGLQAEAGELKERSKKLEINMNSLEFPFCQSIFGFYPFGRRGERNIFF